ncbi:MAG: DUF599 family protein [Xanthobacteraceae bacterium]
MSFFSPLDIAALAFFVLAWIAYAVAVEGTSFGESGLNGRINAYRALWLNRTLARDTRMVDMQIMTALNSGTAFFASTSLIAIGAALSLLRATEEVLPLLSGLPVGVITSREQWEAKTLGLVVILVYAFFKFSWSYRLFNYVAIMLGAMPPVAEKDTAEAQTQVVRTTRVFVEAGRHFNRGQRALFFALGYLGWYIHPLVLVVTTAAVFAVMVRRQFASAPLRALQDRQ